MASESPREPSRARRGHEKRLLLLDGVRFREFYRNPRNPRLTIEINVYAERVDVKAASRRLPEPSRARGGREKRVFL